jgi:tungstate transport system ATP-binding protein
VVETILPLKLRGASVIRRGNRLVGPVDLDLGPEGLTVLMGPNGSGKTSLLRLMHGLERPAEGTLDWAAPARVARERQAYVFQTPIMMRRSVLECIAYPLLVHGTARPSPPPAGVPRPARVGLGHALERQAPVLSGGEKQKLALARALIRKPDILFLDEPCANLDGRATREIEEILLRARGNGLRIVMATHDMGQARRLADEVLFLVRGSLHEAGDATSFFERPTTEKAIAFLNGDIVE